MASSTSSERFSTDRFLGYRKPHKAHMATQSLDSNTALCSCQTTLYSVNPLLAVGAVLALAMSLYTFAMVSSMEERVLTVMEGRILTNSKDRTGMRNFANVFTGADVIEALTSSTHTSLDPRSGAVAWKPETVISPGLEAGRCWSFSGTSGHIGISLADEIIVTNLTVEHIALDLAPNLNTAPKDMTLWGLLDDASEVRKFRSRLRGHSLDKAVLPVSEPLPAQFATTGFVPLFSFSYNVHAKNFLQTFLVPPYLLQFSMPVRRVLLEIQTNWGNELQTCLYRIRIHGSGGKKSA